MKPIIKLVISGLEHVPMAPIENSELWVEHITVTPITSGQCILKAVGTSEQSGNITVAVGASFVGI
jgi:hypothetical protein